VKDFIARVVERIDALVLRQRILLFFVLACVLVLAAESVFTGPLRAKHRRLMAEVAQEQKELSTLQAELQRLVQGNTVDPDAANRRREAALREDLRQLNARVVEEQRRFTPPDRMRRVLEELLERNRGLSLVDLKTLPAVAVAGQRSGPAGGGMYRHGIELTVRGTYGELYEYLRALENLPNQLYWGRAELAVDAHPLLTLRLTVHTLSFDRAWLIV
jgi:MSHA biogenesis protein MshJ